MVCPKRKQNVCEAYAYTFCKLLTGSSSHFPRHLAGVGLNNLGGEVRSSAW